MTAKTKSNVKYEYITYNVRHIKKQKAVTKPVATKYDFDISNVPLLLSMKSLHLISRKIDYFNGIEFSSKELLKLSKMLLLSFKVYRSSKSSFKGNIRRGDLDRLKVFILELENERILECY
jgi:hypothetical protein